MVTFCSINEEMNLLKVSILKEVFKPRQVRLSSSNTSFSVKGDQILINVLRQEKGDNANKYILFRDHSQHSVTSDYQSSRLSAQRTE